MRSYSWAMLSGLRGRTKCCVRSAPGYPDILTDQDNIHIQAGLPALLAFYTTAPPSFTFMRSMLRA